MSRTSMFESLNYENSDESDKIEQIFAQLNLHYQNYKDPWGFDLNTCKQAVKLMWPLYRKYFKVRVFGAENVENKPYMITSNHTGQVPVDAMLITLAFLLDVYPPRMTRGMVERFLAGLPFLGSLTAQTGSILGDRANAEYLLQNGESLLVFPEGVRGISKSTQNFYQLQSFTKGFFRIALKAQRDILPVAVIGAEEMFPFVYQAKYIAKLFGLPALPVSLNYLPLPSPIDIYIGKPYAIPKDLSPEASDKDISEHIIRIETKIKRMIAVGIKERRAFFDTIRVPLSDLIKEKRK